MIFPVIYSMSSLAGPLSNGTHGIFLLQYFFFFIKYANVLLSIIKLWPILFVDIDHFNKGIAAGRTVDC